jgi:hypothetical protein
MGSVSRGHLTGPGTPHTACAGLAKLRSARLCWQRYVSKKTYIDFTIQFRNNPLTVKF